jgi:hypothetical protein
MPPVIQFRHLLAHPDVAGYPHPDVTGALHEDAHKVFATLSIEEG